MRNSQAVSSEEIIRRGSVKDVDVQKLRQAIYEDGVVDAEEAATIFAINDACPVQDRSWADFFVESITDHIVAGAQPEGYLTAENAAWVIERIGRDGHVDSKTELDLLVNILDKARWSPVSLATFALEQVKLAVVHGEGALRSGKPMQKGVITEDEVELLRRILYAFGGDGNVAITRPEAEVLFDINDATDDGTLNAAWNDLFVKAMANMLMSVSSYSVPSREEALRREAWLASEGDLSLGAMLKCMVSASFGAVRDCYRDQSAEERALARLERQRIEIITNEEISEVEARWLAERIGRDGRMTANEAAILSYIKELSPRLHPSLEELVGRLRPAA